MKILFPFLVLTCMGLPPTAQAADGAPDARCRILVSTDIGGSDPDDFQSMIHLLTISDQFDIEGLVSSPWGAGRKEHILETIGHYETDYPKLRERSDAYPTPEYLRSITKQGAVERAPSKGRREPTEGSEWIARCARRDDPRPLYVLVWGLLEDLAQALHDHPDIAGNIRVVYIGGPNKKWGANAYNYIEQNFPGLWMIENNSSYRGFFAGGEEGGFGTLGFYENHIRGRGALGMYFGRFRGGDIKMGDTPSLLYLLPEEPESPEDGSWGGRFQRTLHRPKFVFGRHTRMADRVEAFSIVEWNFRGPDTGPASDGIAFTVTIGGQEFDGYYEGGGLYRFRWCPKQNGEWRYSIRSEVGFLDGASGAFASVPEGTLESPDGPRHANWWTDILDPAMRIDGHSGARTVNRWRETALRHWKERLDRLAE